MPRRIRESAIVFGATGDLGRAIVKGLLCRRTDIILGTWGRGKQVPEYPPIRWIHFDATTIPEDGLASEIENVPRPLHALFFCIGIPSTKQIITDTTSEEWLRLFQVNCLSFVYAYTHLRDVCRESQTRIVVLSSDATRTVRKTNGSYTASKTALEVAALTLAKEEATHGVRINVLSPSLVDSQLGKHILCLKGITNTIEYSQTQPWGRLLTPSEVAMASDLYGL